MRKLFTEYQSIIDTYGADDFAIWLHIVGGILITVSFMVIGILCVRLAKINTRPPRTKKHIILTQLFGFFLMSCAVSRAIDLICIFHNYALVAGLIKVFTGLLAMLAIVYIPAVISENNQRLTIEDIDAKLTNTSEKLEQLKELNEKLTGT